MDDETIKKLKEKGFESSGIVWSQKFKEVLPYPSLSELIHACGNDFEALVKQSGGWGAITSMESYMIDKQVYLGSTPEEAVANLWIALKKKNA